MAFQNLLWHAKFNGLNKKVHSNLIQIFNFKIKCFTSESKCKTKKIVKRI